MLGRVGFAPLQSAQNLRYVGIGHNEFRFGKCSNEPPDQPKVLLADNKSILAEVTAFARFRIPVYLGVAGQAPEGGWN